MKYCRITFGLYIVLAVFGSSWAQCPDQCQCYGTTMRCMFQKLESIPRIPSTTTILDLRFNVISDIPTGAFRGAPRLDTILLNNNEIEVIRDDAFNGLSDLRYLYLYKNKIREVHPNAFKLLGKLEQIFLHGNDLKTLPLGLFASNKNLKQLRLDSNPLRCDCNIAWLAKMLKENVVQTQAAATCDYPETLKDKSFMDVDLADFHCDRPTLTRQPIFVDSSLGSTAVLRCNLLETSKIMWTKNNAIVDVQQSRYNVLLDGTLVITGVQKTDEGSYACAASNAVIGEQTRVLELRISASINHQREQQKFPNNEQSGSQQRPLNDTVIITQQQTYEQLTSGLKQANDRIYTNHVQNEAELKRSNRIVTDQREIDERLPQQGRTNNVAPNFVSRPSDVNAALGDTVDFQCSATGVPTPEITWTHNGNALRLNSRVSIIRGSLHIVSVREEDGGDYRCMAENVEGIITTAARLNVQIAPQFVLRPVDIVLPANSTAVFQCDAMGEPTPLISWYKDNNPLPNNGRFQILDSGRTLRISRIEPSDKDVYVCRAESAAGRMEAQAELQVQSRDTPRLDSRVIVEQDVEAGADTTIDCHTDGQTSPQFRWIKDGIVLRNGRKYLIEESYLTIKRLIESDAGLYECFSENTLGFARKTVKLNVIEQTPRPGDRFVDEAIRQATQRVGNAINITRNELFDRGRVHGVQDLLTMFRYPSAESLELARAEEIFEQTLEIIHRHVADGHTYDLDGHELMYQEIVSPAHLSLIANMSGCLRLTSVQKCTNMCFHKKYRSIDGTCNNLQHPTWGSANTALRRLLPPMYENGFNAPIGWNKGRLYNGVHVPSPRLVSSVVISTETVSTNHHDTHMIMQWGQFIDHDLDLTPQSISQHIFSDGRRCNETCENVYPCFPIDVPSSDHRMRGHKCLGFHRSSATCNTGQTSIFFKTFAPRQQLNALTAFMDGSQIYGNSEDLAERLRDFSHENGHLLVGSTSQQGGKLLPYDFHGIIGPSDCQIEPSKRYIPCFLAGDARVNEQLALTAMHTLWMREHNRIASELQEINPHWDGNMLYHEARKIVGAMLQHITYTAWLPNILGPQGMSMLGEYRGYDPSIDVSISNEFATAAMRFGHSLIQPVLQRLNESFQTIPQGHLSLHKAFFSPYRLVEEGGIDPLLRGLFVQGAKMKMPSEIMNSELTEKLFALANRVGQDLASLNIQRSRDHGIPFYNFYRKLTNLTEAKTFTDLKNEIQDKNTRDALELVYGSVDNIDLFVGGMAETPLEDAKVGPTLAYILVDQFKRLRDGDRFWYENDMVFSPDQLVQLKQFTLARVICDSSDSITRVQRDVFTMVHSEDEYISCNSIPKIDLKMWSDCCMDCGKAGDFRSITSHFRRRRDSEHSYSSSQPDTEGNLDSLKNLRGHVYNKQEVDLKMREMESRLKDMTNVVHSMENNVKQVKRNMRRMVTHASDDLMCMDETGQKRPHNDKWNKDECTVCRCYIGEIKCKTGNC